MNLNKTAPLLLFVLSLAHLIACAPPSSRNSKNQETNSPASDSNASSQATQDNSAGKKGADSSAHSSEVLGIKTEILELSHVLGLRPDPDFTLQDQLEPLVQKLLKANPQPPVQDRLELLDGPWHQEYGSLDYRHYKRGFDPRLEIGENYQVFSRSGYFYNVSPLGKPPKIRVGLLRGEFKIRNPFADILDVRFTQYQGINGFPKNGERIWDLAARAESGTLEAPIHIKPTWIARLFYGGGQFREVYTDSDMRITFCSHKGSSKREVLYIFNRIKEVKN
jgi:hypothetical protein